MKKYRLKQWYPSLGNDFEIGCVVYYDKERGGYSSINNRDISLRKREVENNPDFWELIEEKKPLFTTEDGVEIYRNNVELFGVNSTFITATDNEFDYDVCKKEGWKLFFHKSNAYEYILWNKPLLSMLDIDGTIKGYLPEFDELMKIAEERLNH